MANFNKSELVDYCRQINWYVDHKGLKFGYCEARYQASQIFLANDCKEQAFEQLTLAKNELYKIVKNDTKKISPDGKGLDIFDYDSYCRDRNVETKELQLFWNIMLLEAPHKFDSYLLYLEKNRQDKDKFYEPRRDCLRKTGVVSAMQDLEDGKLHMLSISFPPGTGKAQPLYSKVLTPKGFVPMGDIKVGSRVISASGKESTVLGVYPQGKRKIYELTLDDGSKCRASDNHLWTVQTREDRRIRKIHPAETYRTITTEDMLKNLYINNGTRANYSIDYVKPIEFSHSELLLHPYVMGVLIGDGYLGATPEFATKDQEVIDLVNRFLPKGYSVEHKDRVTYKIKGHEGNNCKAGSLVTKAIKNYGLFGKTSINKHIPKEYLYADYEQRMWLLRGLMDTDGTVSKGIASYCTISPQLADDVIELVHSLGGYASKNKKNCGYTDKNGNYISCNDAYNIIIAFDSENKEIFGLTRKQEKYNPKRNRIRRIIKSIEYIGEEECQCIYIDDPSHLYITDDYIITHNTTLEKFFLSWVIGKHPEDYNLFFSHSSDITRMFYDGVLDITTNDTEYTFKEIFPWVMLESTNAKSGTINFNGYKPFASLQVTSVGAKNSGKVRANRYLFCDDLIGGIEEALNKELLDKLWRIYGTDARQRKLNENVREIHIATRWSVNDVIGRLKVIYAGDPKAKFIAVPDIDPKTGESNFNYKVNGMSVEFFNDQAQTMDDITYRCLYKNEPIEREGILYHDDELRRYLSLPLQEPDAIFGVCDTKAKGTDFMVLPCVYQYGEDYYCVDAVCDDTSDYGVQYQKLANIIWRNNMQQCEFESNSGGDRVSFEVDKLVTQMGGRCNITNKPTESNKETRIIVNADWVKKHVIFKDKSLYTEKEDYGVMMSWLCRYSLVGKNVHDDIPDAFANLSLYATKGKRGATCSAIFNPFRSNATTDFYSYGYGR